jgi:general secretion pathway protein G
MAARVERSQRAFTLIEIAVALAIVGTLAALASTAYGAYIERVRVLRAVIEIKTMATDLEGFLAVGGGLPATLADAGFGTPEDPWGYPYRYLPLYGKQLPPVGAPPAGAGAGAGQGGGGPTGGGSGDGGSAAGQARKDRFLVPINTDFDLYSVGRDGESVASLAAVKSRDDVVRAANGAFIGLASKF